MLLFFSMLSWMLSMVFMTLKHPLSLGAILLLQTIVISSMSGMLCYDFWFSYILFLIMIGGMLVLFVYMTSVASDEKFKFSMNLTLFVILALMLNFMLLMSDSFMLMIDNLNYNFSNQMSFNSNISMNKYLNFPSVMIMMLLMVYLLVTLITIVKIAQSKKGPLRQKL